MTRLEVSGASRLGVPPDCATRLCHPKALLRAYPGVAWHLPEAINLSLLMGEKCGRYSEEV